MGRPKKEISIVKPFLVSLVLTLPQLFSYFRCSRSTVLRRLKEHGYITSYNNRGRFITIEEVACFDSRGLWLCKGARFSKHGTLRNTVHKFVYDSEKGMTHEELTKILGLRVHDTLLYLVNKEKIHREKIGSSFVYLSVKRSIQKNQKKQRKRFLKTIGKPRITNRQKIATLLEIIKDQKATRKEIVDRCRNTGVNITHDVVDTIFEHYDLEKKKAL